MSSSDHLLQWWTAEATTTGAATAAKLDEYGAADLVGIGHTMAAVTGRQIDDGEAFELGCFFYVVGKITRAQSAYERERRPSDDTWLDLSVYAKMVLAYRAGVWPTQTTQEQ